MLWGCHKACLKVSQSLAALHYTTADGSEQKATASNISFSIAAWFKEAKHDADETLFPSRPDQKDSVLGRSRAECTQVRAANAAHRHNASGAMG